MYHVFDLMVKNTFVQWMVKESNNVWKVMVGYECMCSRVSFMKSAVKKVVHAYSARAERMNGTQFCSKLIPQQIKFKKNG